MSQASHSASTALAGATLGLPARGLAPRTMRVSVLLTAIVAMSLADLHLTLLMLQSIGLAEENPIARYIIALDSPFLLGLWKLGTVGLAGFVLVRLRQHAIAEAAAWLGAAILTGVMVHWWLYAAQVEEIIAAIDLLERGFDERWIAMTPR